METMIKVLGCLTITALVMGSPTLFALGLILGWHIGLIAAFAFMSVMSVMLMIGIMFEMADI